MRRSVCFALAGLVLAAAPAAAQSLFGTRGLGVPVAPLDGRARALGGIGVGLLGFNPSLVNPADVAGVPLRGVAAAIQPTSRTLRLGGEEDDVGGTRFPLVRVVYPVGPRLVVSLGYGAFLDQSWAVVSDTAVVLGGDTVRARDLIESDGGLAQLRLGLAYPLTNRLAVGAGAGLYTGSLRRSISRTFPEAPIPGLRGFESAVEWDQTAPLLDAGVRWDPLDALRISGSVTWSGRLDLDADDPEAQDRSVDLPLQVAAGAGAVLAPRLLATAGFRWAGWDAAADDFGDRDAADDSWEVGAGVEWGGPRADTRSFPVRLGFHYGKLPFKLAGEAPTEWALALGLGARLAVTEAGPLAIADAAIERGSVRDAEGSGLTEDFWRLTISLTLFGR